MSNKKGLNFENYHIRIKEKKTSINAFTMGHQQRGCDNPLRTKGKPSVAVKNTTTLTHKNSQKIAGI